MKSDKNVPELRRDLVSGTWVVFSTKRKFRPDDTHKGTPRVSDNCDDPKDCPFCKENFDKQGQDKDSLAYFDKKGDWTVRVFPNKFPILSSKNNNLNKREEGPFEIMDGVGYHEVLITVDHRKNFPDLKISQIVRVFDAYQERYLSLMNRRNVKYISI